MSWLDGIIDSMDMSWCKLWERVKDREAWHSVVHGVSKSQTHLSDWTTVTLFSLLEIHGIALRCCSLINTGRGVPMRMIWCISLIQLPTIGFLKAKMIISITISYTGLSKKN